ncbi:glycyl-radical enzyme activating protein [Paenibacillus sp. BR2-3]|uniref:glycyl-radical enzyme activating protein n=1 Tax=Paenibacillus sp. BR2-3 TaxID=3048494 RepID=UPI003977774F
MIEFDMEAKGIVCDIQRYSLHDGPGIRSIVFLQGCPLRCVWCSNPETQAMQSQLMYQEEKCRDCRRCAAVCPVQAISYTPMLRIDRSRCISCGQCAEVCHTGALAMSGKGMTVREVIQELKKDESYYRRSSGGITFSGGEPLFQSSYVIELMRACKSQGWHTAVETTAFCNPDVLENVLPLLDLVLLDIKHMDDRKHEQYVKQSNELVLSNALRLAQLGAAIIVRVPVIPGFNNTVREIGEIAAFAAGLPGIKELHLLPFHRLGANKYNYLESRYSMENNEPPADQEMESLRRIVVENGLYCQIGG